MIVYFIKFIVFINQIQIKIIIMHFDFIKNFYNNISTFHLSFYY